MTRIISVLALLLLAGSPVQAETLTVEEAVRAALEMHPDVAGARAAVDRAGAVRAQAGSSLRPRVGWSARYAYHEPIPVIEVDPGIPGLTPIRQELGDEHNAGVALEAGWRIWDGGRRRQGVRAAEAGQDAARYGLEETRVRLALEVRLLAYGQLLARESEAVLAGSLQSAREHALQAAARRDAGTGTDLERTRAEVRVAELESRLVEIREEGLRLGGELAVLTGRIESGGVVVQGELEERSQRELEPTDPAEEHPAIRALTAATEAARSRLRSESRSRSPTLDLAASVGAEYPYFFQTEWSETWQVGLRLNHSLYEGGGRRSRVSEIRAGLRETEARLESARSELTRRSIRIQGDARSARASIQAARRRLEQSEDYLRAARVSASAGLATDLDVRDAELALDASRLALRRAQFESCAARARWQALSGVAEEEP